MFVADAAFSTASLDDYRHLVGDEIVDRIAHRARKLRDARVLHVNATAIGGGVAELLLSILPLMRNAGVHTDWYVLEAEDKFFEVTKRYHNALQGALTSWSAQDFEIVRATVRRNAEQLRRTWREYDFVVVHDPQPLLLPELLEKDAGWIWRCHIDLTTPEPAVWEPLEPHLARYDRMVFSMPEYVGPGLDPERTRISAPSIDPFRPKNRRLDPQEIPPVLQRYGVDPTRPYLLQVSRFDPWKDPVGVVGVYRRLKPRLPELQLVYMAAMASDDPEGQLVYEETRAAAGNDPDIHLLALDVPAEEVDRNAYEVNAFQRGARVVLQKSLREGFGLTVAEALWKERPVVAGNVGGIRYQIQDGRNGFLVDSVEECTERVARLLNDPLLAEELGRQGHRSVRERFLLTRLLDDYFGWFLEIGAETHGPDAGSAPSSFAT